MSNDIRMVKIFHDLNLLIDILLQVGFLFDVDFADDLDGEQFIIIFFLRIWITIFG